MSLIINQNKCDNSIETCHIMTLFDTSLNYIITHISVTCSLCIGLLGLNISIEPVLLILTPMMFFYSIFYAVISSIYITRFFEYRNTRISNGINALRDGCTDIAFKNYRLLNEYQTVYEYHYRDTMQKSIEKIKSGNQKTVYNGSAQNDISDYVHFVLQNDATDKMDNTKQIGIKIEQIYQYINLAYYLTFLNPTDSLTLNVDSIRINIGSESIFNKRNRRLEDLINLIDLQKKRELIKVWNSNGTICVVPIRWISVSYRNIFRYIYCAKYLKEIYNSFDKDYASFENSVENIAKAMKSLTSEQEIMTKHFQTLHFIMNDVLIIFIDLFVSATIIKSYNLYGALLIPAILGIIVIISLSIIIRSLKFLLNEQTDTKLNSTDIEYIDKNIESIFNDMRVLTTQ
jgi:hypothetical protein